MTYDESDFLMISGIQHFCFCKRQWALIHIEQAWLENSLTYEGQQLHQKADQPEIREHRGDKLIMRALPVHSRVYGLSGICDVVEFTKNKDGIQIQQAEGDYQPVAVEYKHGKKKYDLSDTLQLLGESICLEEMLGCTIDHGEIFYQKTRRRESIEFTDDLRTTFEQTITEMRQYWQKRYTPKVKTGAWCRSCSLKDICLPELLKRQSVASYLKRKLSE
jgi:CRISPR-associated exonuclease Cas4